MFCQNCGAQLPDGAKFCGNCGARVEDTTNAPVMQQEHPIQGPSVSQQPVYDQQVSGLPPVFNPEYPSEAPSQAHPPKIPWHSRGRLAPDYYRAKRVSVVFVLAIVVFQVVLLLIFAALGERLESEMLTAQIVGFIPTLFLIIYLFSLDTIEREPVGLLLKLFLVEGLLTLFVVAYVELAFESVALSLLDEDSTLFAVVDNLICVALVEEGFKYLVLRLFTWKHKAFNYRFDGIVYAAVTALGFAAFENALYIMDDGLATALVRMVSAVPGHCVDGILMGIFYGQAKVYDARGDKSKSKLYRLFALLAPIAEHGFYDFFASLDFPASDLLFYAYVLFLNATVFVLVWRLAQKDEAVAQTYEG